MIVVLKVKKKNNAGSIHAAIPFVMNGKSMRSKYLSGRKTILSRVTSLKGKIITYSYHYIYLFFQTLIILVMPDICLYDIWKEFDKPAFIINEYFS